MLLPLPPAIVIFLFGDDGCNEVSRCDTSLVDECDEDGVDALMRWVGEELS